MSAKQDHVLHHTALNSTFSPTILDINAAQHGRHHQPPRIISSRTPPNTTTLITPPSTTVVRSTMSTSSSSSSTSRRTRGSGPSSGYHNHNSMHLTVNTSPPPSQLTADLCFDLSPVSKIQNSLTANTKGMFRWLRPLDSSTSDSRGLPPSVLPTSNTSDNDVNISDLPDIAAGCDELFQYEDARRIVNQFMNDKSPEGIVMFQQAKEKLYSQPSTKLPCMMIFAILDSKEIKSTVRSIYSWVRDTFPFYSTHSAGTGWKSLLRNGLSLNSHIKRVANSAKLKSPGKGCFWSLKTGSLDHIQDSLRQSKTESVATKYLMAVQRARSVVPTYQCVISFSYSPQNIEPTKTESDILANRKRRRRPNQPNFSQSTTTPSSAISTHTIHDNVDEHTANLLVSLSSLETSSQSSATTRNPSSGWYQRGNGRRVYGSTMEQALERGDETLLETPPKAMFTFSSPLSLGRQTNAPVDRDSMGSTSRRRNIPTGFLSSNAKLVNGPHPGFGKEDDSRDSNLEIRQTRSSKPKNANSDQDIDAVTEALLSLHRSHN
eukprot:m.47753 g.47753  ORF g.47753 m.47753 type:complete len:547 (+) comp7356_c0_seq2:177-1817(+)